jgi:phytoene dehydrogenase-like protein
VLERRDHVGGAAVSSARGLASTRLSRYAYLVSLLPQRSSTSWACRSGSARRISSYTPLPADPPRGLLVDAEDRERTAASLHAATGDPAAIDGWERLYATCARAARAVWPTMTEPLLPAAELRARVGDDAAWAALVERPIGELIEDCLDDDAVRGIALTDALIGPSPAPTTPTCARTAASSTTSSATAAAVDAHGRMGAVTAELEAAARAGQAALRRRGARSSVRRRRRALHRRGRRRARRRRRARTGQRRPAVLDRLRGHVAPGASQGAAEGQPAARTPAG